MKRRTAREKALQALFQIDIGKINVDDAYQFVIEDSKEDDFLKEIVYGTHQHLAEIDELIQTFLDHWTLDRLGSVDRNLLRIAVYELMYMPDIPASVTISEAVEIAKKFGDDKSSRFINGVLSKIKQYLDEKMNESLD